MKRIVAISAMLTLGMVLGFTSLQAEADGDQILEECLTEAHGRGYDIESDAFAERVANAIINEDEGTMMEVCPSTFQKYDN